MRKKNLKFFIVGIIIALVVGYLVYGATRNAGLYYLTVSELMERKITDRPIRVSGQVVDGSIKWYLEKTALNKERIYEFIITDKKNNLLVRYKGSLPDTFKPGREVVVEGGYGKDGIFKAKKVIGKCPSKYEVIK